MARTFLSGVRNWNTGVCRREMEVFDQMTLGPPGKAPLSENEPQENGQHLLTGNTQPAP